MLQLIMQAEAREIPIQPNQKPKEKDMIMFEKTLSYSIS